MQIIFNKAPHVSYTKEAYTSLLEDGYALPIANHGDATVLLFKDVADHTDGNGMALFWMLEGAGTFFHGSNKIVLTSGDVIAFDDCIEHGFQAEDYCLAANFDISLEPACDVARMHELINTFNMPMHGNTELVSGVQNF